MRAVSRLGMLAFAAGLSLGSHALAQSTGQNTGQTTPQNTTQSTPPPTTSAPAPDTVGPRELQNFSLGGTTTRPAETPPAATNPLANPVSRAGPAPTANGRSQPSAASSASPRPTRNRAAAPAADAARQVQSAPPAIDLGTAAPPPAAASPSTPAPQASAPQFAPEPEATTSEPAPNHRSSMLPWLLAAVVLAAAAGLLLWRRRPREALAGGPAFDSYEPPQPPAPRPAPPKVVTPEPALAAAGFVTTRVGGGPVPLPEPLPAPAPTPQPVGIVSTRLRPWLEVTLIPVACQVDGEQVVFELEIELFNSGAALARDPRLHATLFNAGPTQEQDIGAFMARPAIEGEPLASLGPLQRMNFRISLAASRASLQLFELGGRQVFVPLIAFNATYRWSGGEGQTSASYLIGRDTGAEKLAPIRADLGPRALGGLGTRPLPNAVRR